MTDLTHLLISSVSPRRKSNAYPVSADRTRSAVKRSKWAEWHAHMELSPQGGQGVERALPWKIAIRSGGGRGFDW